MGYWKKIFILGTVSGILLLSGCQQNFQFASKVHEQDPDKRVIKLEYLNPEQLDSDDAKEWLNKVKKDLHIHVHQFSQDGREYVYAKGFRKAKATYNYTDLGGNTNSTLTITLVEGKAGDEILVQVSYDGSVCCNGTELDIIDAEGQF